MSRASQDPTGEEAENRPPDASGEDMLRAIVRDPRSVYLHWRLEGAASADARQTLGPECKWYLRVLNLSEGGSRSLPVDPEAGNYYVDVRPGRTYGFELAASDGDRWRTVCRTGRVQVPPAPGAGGERRRSVFRRALRGGDRLRPAGRGADIAGLRFETTELVLGSSPHGGPRPTE